jgi:uncharacterized protein YjiS (DUF1127 family)
MNNRYGNFEINQTTDGAARPWIVVEHQNVSHLNGLGRTVIIGRYKTWDSARRKIRELQWMSVSANPEQRR